MPLRTFINITDRVITVMKVNVHKYKYYQQTGGQKHNPQSKTELIGKGRITMMST